MKAKRIKALVSALLVSAFTLTGCADTNTGKYEEYMLGVLEEKYEMEFEFTDSKYLKMSNTSIANDDVIYGYAHPVDRGQYESQNFYVETNSSCTSVSDSFIAMKIQNQLNSYLSSELLNVQTTIQSKNEDTLQYEKPKLSLLGNYELPFDATCILPVDVEADLAVDELTGEFVDLCDRLTEYSYNENGCLVLFINPDYEEEAIRYVNHDLGIEAKLDQDSVYASININNLEDSEEDIKEQLQTVADKLRELRKKK